MLIVFEQNVSIVYQKVFAMIVIRIVHYLFVAYSLMILIRILSSWIPQLAHQQWMRFVVFYTDPYLNFFRKIIPPLGMMDFSPMVALIALRLCERYIILPALIKLFLW